MDQRFNENNNGEIMFNGEVIHDVAGFLNYQDEIIHMLKSEAMIWKRRYLELMNNMEENNENTNNQP